LQTKPQVLLPLTGSSSTYLDGSFCVVLLDDTPAVNVPTMNSPAGLFFVVQIKKPSKAASGMFSADSKKMIVFKKNHRWIIGAITRKTFSG
jgi:hypothetical protein